MYINVNYIFFLLFMNWICAKVSIETNSNGTSVKIIFGENDNAGISHNSEKFFNNNEML